MADEIVESLSYNTFCIPKRPRPEQGTSFEKGDEQKRLSLSLRKIAKHSSPYTAQIAGEIRCTPPPSPEKGAGRAMGLTEADEEELMADGGGIIDIIYKG